MTTYYNFKVLKINTIAICFFVMFSVFMTLEVLATEYYIDPVDGSDSYNGLTQTNAWATLAYATDQLSAGDTLYLMDGTYTKNTTGLLHIFSSSSGTAGNPITYKALNDGQAFVDGKDSGRPLRIVGDNVDGLNLVHDIDIEGIVFGNSNADCCAVYLADRINIRRVSGFDSLYSDNTVVFHANRSTNVLFEDCASYGDGRNNYDIYESQNCTVRRCWGNWEDWMTGRTEPLWYMQIYGSDNTITENCVGRTDSTRAGVSGIAVWANTYNKTAHNNKFYGNIMYGFKRGSGYWIGSAKNNIMGNEFHHNVSIKNRGGFYQRGDDGLVVRNFSIINNSTTGCYLFDDMHEGYTLNADFITSGTMKHSVLINEYAGGTGLYVERTGTYGSFSNSYNYHNADKNWRRHSSRGVGDIDGKVDNVDSNYNTDVYGDGAYLMAPTALKGKGENRADIGAEVIYRYEDGVLTNEPLWPWPMEDRIFAETGISVTWEANGGLWKTLDGVYTGGQQY